MDALTVTLGRFDKPDEVRTFEKGRLELVRIGSLVLGRARYEPGWRWSEHVGPSTGATRCEVEHVGMVLSGAATVAFDDGRIIELGEGSLFHVPPVPHDSWVVGDRPYVSLHFLGADEYARKPNPPGRPAVALYDAQYGNLEARLNKEIRAEAFGEDIGQNSWLSADEQDLFIDWLALAPQARLLDVACGSGGPALRIAARTGCSVQGVDVHERAIEEARAGAARASLRSRAAFDRVDASRPLPYPDASFDGIVCIDAVNHFPDRGRVFRDWLRVLRPGGRLVFTDPIVVTGPLTHDEMAIRSSIGFFLFVPPGTDERLLAQAGFEAVEVLDRTENMARLAARRRAAREKRAADLKAIEGASTFEGQQRFLEVAALLAADRRLSRFAFRALRPI
jgi:SAM-dependent methyltransferase